MLDTSARLLRLLAILTGRAEWTGPELADRLGVTVRTLRRDIARLRELGYEVQASRGVAGGYRLAAGSALPPLLLDDEEAIAVALSLGTATNHTVTGAAETALRALSKLERVLPGRLRQQVAALRLATVPLTDQAPTADPDVLARLAQCCQQLHRIAFGYRDRDGTTSERTVQPHRLVHTGRRWYLVARDETRDDWRTFRVDRITGLRSTGTRFTPRDVPDAAAFVAGAVTTAPYRYRARVIVHAPAASVADRIPPTAGTVEAIDDERSQLTAGADSPTLLAVHLAMLGHEFTVVEPRELIDEIGVLAERLSRAFRASEPT